MSERSRIGQANKILTAEKKHLSLEAKPHPRGAVLVDSAGAVVWSGPRNQLVAEVRRRVNEAVSAWAAAEAEKMPELPSY